MPVTEILLLRHGHRIAWTLDPTTGKYSSSHRFPTGLPADPPLASHGVRQAQETGDYLSKALFEIAKQDRLRIYSSLFYRCLETLRPTVDKLRKDLISESALPEDLLQNLHVRGERGVGEWFGHAWFIQPVPAEPSRLKQDFFPWLDENYQSQIVPDLHGESIAALHDRIAKAFSHLIRDLDNQYTESGRGQEDVTLLVCGHAAQIICSGRVLTGQVPEDYDEEDFKCFTCGISKFTRKSYNSPGADEEEDWKSNGGIAGGWECVLNSDCSHLSQGEERGWHFHGDESFDSYEPEQKTALKISDGSVSSKPKQLKDINDSHSKL